MPAPSVSVLDPSTDKGFTELARLAKVYDFPEFVKQASLEETTQPDRIAITAYADPVRRRYPCHSAAATWVSNMYFQEKRAEYHPKDQARIQQRLDSFIGYFRIKSACDATNEKAAAVRRGDPLPDSAYAYVWEAADGHKDRRLPMTNTMEVKAAAEWLSKYHNQLPYRDRNKIANKILEKAAAYGAGLPDHLEYLERQAGLGIPDTAEVVDMLQQRAKLARDQQQREKIAELANTVRSSPRTALQPGTLVDLAITLDTIDRSLGLTAKYGEYLQAPENVIFKVTYTKAAEDFHELCPLTTGNAYSRDQLAKVGRDTLESLFGTDFVQEVSTGLDIDPEKLAAVVATLPRPDAQLFDQLMQETGQQPQWTEKQSRDLFSGVDLEALAAAY